MSDILIIRNEIRMEGIGDYFPQEDFPKNYEEKSKTFEYGSRLVKTKDGGLSWQENQEENSQLINKVK